jgi:tellurite resistance protein
VSQSLRALPIGMYGAVMGLAGLALAWRKAGGLVPLAASFAELWLALAILALTVLLPAYLLKLLHHPAAVRAEFADPGQLGFCATLPIGITLVAAGLQPHSARLAEAIWWPAVILFFGLQLWMLARLARGGVTLAQVNGGWLIMLVGGIVVPSSGIPLGHPQISAWFFGFSGVAAPFVVGAVLYRTVFGPPLPEPAKPTTFILLVPPALIYANGLALGATDPGWFMQGLYFTSLMLLAVFLACAAGCARWPFGAPWWAFTFPVDAVALAALRYAADRPGTAWKYVALGVLTLATVIVIAVLVRTVLALRQGRLLPAPLNQS